MTTDAELFPAFTDAYGAPVALQPTGQERKREAVKRGAKHADPEWFRRALEVVRHVARERSLFTMDDIDDAARQLIPAGVTTHDLRAWAGVLKSALSEGIIEQTGRWPQSRRPKTNAKRIAEYKPGANAT